MEEGTPISNVIRLAIPPRKHEEQQSATDDDLDDFPLGSFFRLAADGGIIFSVNEPVEITLSKAQAEELGVVLIQAAAIVLAVK